MKRDLCCAFYWVSMNYFVALWITSSWREEPKRVFFVCFCGWQNFHLEFYFYFFLKENSIHSYTRLDFSWGLTWGAHFKFETNKVGQFFVTTANRIFLHLIKSATINQGHHVISLKKRLNNQGKFNQRPLPIFGAQNCLLPQTCPPLLNNQIHP